MSPRYLVISLMQMAVTWCGSTTGAVEKYGLLSYRNRYVTLHKWTRSVSVCHLINIVRIGNEIKMKWFFIFA
jgi:hypothetical protein